MNDEDILRDFFSSEEISAYKKIKDFQNKIRIFLENYINLFLPIDGVRFVGRNKNRPEGVDYIVYDEKWSVKNAWNTENSSMKKAREIEGIKHWYRLNKDTSTNWNSFFIPNISPSEDDFCQFVGGNKKVSLMNFY